MRESFKANLPYFTKVFTELGNFADFLKNFIVETDSFINYARHAQGSGSVTAGSDLPGKNCLSNTGTDADSSKQFFKEYLNNFIEGINSMKETCERVYREVADEPLYLQHESEQYSKFHSKYGKYPLTPVSFNLLPLRSANAQALLLPTKDSSTPLLRYNYGVRATLLDNKEFHATTMPYNKDLVDEFNKSVTASDIISLDHYNQFVSSSIGALRYLVNATVYKGKYFLNNKSIVAVDKLDSSLSKENNLTPTTGKVSFKLSTVFDMIGSINTSSSIDDFVKESITVTPDFKVGTGSAGRERQRKYNLIDLNIIPLNPSALMRDIPLTNLFNYNYTLEKMLSKFLNTSEREIGKLIYDLIESPYRSSIVKPQLINHMMLGKGDNNFGRPKFLSDQLYNKALLHSVYQSSDSTGMYSEDRSILVPPTSTATSAASPTFPELTIDEKPFTGISNKFTYPYKKDGKLEVQEVTKTVTDADIKKETADRFNTVIVRNMVFITNLYRLIRLKLEKDLVQRRSILLPTHTLVDPETTEFGDAENFDEGDYSLGTIAKLK
jgi:hypothetical protein